MDTLPLTEALLRRFDKPGPRYTSYPTADRFRAFDADEARAALRARDASRPLSAYVHIPFCASVCYYCACNKVVTRHSDRAGAYLDDLRLEIAQVADTLGSGCNTPLQQVHFGGGTPTFLTDHQLAQTVDALLDAFDIADDAEMAIEVDPRTVTHRRLAALRAIGFNRLSFGVQDFDPAVQEAVHREQSFEMVRGLIDASRRLGFESINVDLIYGLPRQTPESYARTVAQVASLRPDRIAMYGYAHLPERFKPQRRIDERELPQASQRIEMLGGAVASFLAHGYRYIGMDHFALPTDPLAIAQREGTLRRNFQGYSTLPDGDLLGLGVSAIGRIGDGFQQNAKTLTEYHDLLQTGRLPVQRGLRLTDDDCLRRDVIMALMCRGRVEFDEIEAVHPCLNFREHFAPEFERLLALAGSGLVLLEPRAIQVTAAGWYLVRAVAMVFDAYIDAAPTARGAGDDSPTQPVRFSRVV
jgi:oxygen-independent coproporphyrinogen-3 oxidase